MKKAKKDLVRKKAIIGPIFYIKSKKAAVPGFLIHPPWHDEASKADSIAMIQKACRDLDAREVVVLSDTYIYEAGSQKPKCEAIMVSQEDSGGIQKIILPYKIDSNGKVIFGKEEKEPKRKASPEASAEGLVQ